MIPATLELVHPCPARAEYIELRFTTPEGPFTWCFPEPPPGGEPPGGPIALVVGPYGVQARQFHDGVLGTALESSTALPMMLAGANVHVARRLVAMSR
ncbi:hypothetical protein DPM19_23940 [Actinomadura craniellae]|uniref:Uncharacterized protein n=1 Tax=Actinomadura craniellae TaxID=2231787 RepID=A0A365H0S6_9ACTN|nr:hypothetical protein DPM19_23940 [Actinomadura craniellae]